MELMFAFVFSLFIVALVRIVGQWIKNENSPRLSVPARIVDMRRKTNPRQHTHSYYVTFEVESGDRMELRVQRSAYHQLIVGDCGTLSFQGKRYLAFERKYGDE